MAAVREVQSPDGRVWRIRRRWVPKGPRLRERLSYRRRGDTALDLLSLPDFTWLDDFIGAIVGIVVLIAFVVLVATIILPFIALTAELVIFVVLFTAGVIGRFVFGRPWRIEARTIGAPHREREIFAKGWRGSREAIDELAAQIATDELQPSPSS
jgi:hypothetical protein